jgi:sulfur relay (sulfurtransferase) DsrC/TusE family protein
MNYQNIYESLIAKRQKNPAKGYTERHHILPKSLGGSDDPSNLVVLTGREHWVAHLLLYKIHRNSQTVHACNMMAMKCEERGIPYIKSSRLYEAIRTEHAKSTSKYMKVAQKGERNSQYGTMWICNIELEENKKISKDSDIPEGWIKGRNKWRELFKKVISQEKQAKHAEEKSKLYTENSKLYTEMYNRLIEEGLTLQEFADKYYDKSFVALYMNFKKYVLGYKKTQGKRKFKGA